jgi:hypothetical protein
LQSTIITSDPKHEGRQLYESEIAELREESRAQWVADLLEGLARPDIAGMTRGAKPDWTSPPTEDDVVTIPGRSGYAAIATEAGGIIPLVGLDRAGRSRAILETAKILKRATALVLLDRATTERAIMRSPAPDDSNPIADGAGEQITVDGVTFRTQTDDIGFVDQVV